MAIVRTKVYSLSELSTWLQANAVPGIFKSVEYASRTLTATDSADNTVLEITTGEPFVANGSFKAYRAASNYLGIDSILNFPSSSDSEIDCIACENGVLLKCKVDDSSENPKYFAALFTLTNNDKVAIIFTASLKSTEAACYTETIHHVAFGDDASIYSTTGFTPETGQQTNFCTFCTNAAITNVSFTPKAFYMPMNSFYASGICKFLSGGKLYISNGYWCIDTEQTEDE